MSEITFGRARRVVIRVLVRCNRTYVATKSGLRTSLPRMISAWSRGRRNSIYLSTVLFAVFTCSCTTISGFPDRSYDTKEELAALVKYRSDDALTAYDSADATMRNGMTREQWRNEVLEGRLHDLSLHFGDFEQSLYSQGVGFGVGTDWLALALTSGATLAKGVTAKEFSVGAAAVTGGSATYDKDVLYGKTLTVIMAQMVAQRQTVLVRIRGGEQQSASDYPLTRGLADLDDYYQAGTIPGALTSIAANTGVQSKAAQDSLDSIQLVTLVSPALQARRELVSDYVKSLMQADLNRLATSLNQPQGAGALVSILLMIARATTSAQLDAITLPIKTLFMKEF